MRLIAHRGFAGRYRENTVPAVRRGGRRADAVEVDVRAAADGDPVAIHDRTVDRVTDASGPVSEYDAETLGSLSVLGGEAGVPTLSAVLAAVPDGTGVVAECKEYVPAAVSALSAVDDAVVSSFDPAVLRRVRAADPSLDRALLAVPADGGDRPAAASDPAPAGDADATDVADVPEERASRGRVPAGEAVDRAAATDCVAVHLPAGSVLDRPSLVDRAHDRGLRVAAWTVRERSTARGLARAGVNALIADDPDVVDGAEVGDP